MKKPIALGIVALLAALAGLVMWNLGANIVALIVEVAVIGTSLTALHRIKQESASYAISSRLSEPWTMSLGMSVMAGFFTVLSALQIAGANSAVSITVAAIAPIFFTLFIIFYSNHESEPTVFDAFVKPPN